jgi:hypothetical protein
VANRDSLSGQILVQGSLNSQPGTYRINFCANRAADAFAEGEFLSPNTVDVVVETSGPNSFFAFRCTSLSAATLLKSDVSLLGDNGKKQRTQKA